MRAGRDTMTTSMIRIASISPVERKSYKDIIWQGTNQTEVDAPVLQFYEIQLVTDDGRQNFFDLEVRQTQRGEQVDWYDDLDDYLVQQIPSREEGNRLREQICMAVYKLRGRE